MFIAKSLASNSWRPRLFLGTNYWSFVRLTHFALVRDMRKGRPRQTGTAPLPSCRACSYAYGPADSAGSGQSGRTCSAWGPLAPWPAVNSTRWFS